MQNWIRKNLLDNDIQHLMLNQAILFTLVLVIEYRFKTDNYCTCYIFDEAVEYQFLNLKMPYLFQSKCIVGQFISLSLLVLCLILNTPFLLCNV